MTRFSFPSLLLLAASLSGFVDSTPVSGSQLEARSDHGSKATKIVRCPNGDFAQRRCCVFHSIRDDLQKNVFHHTCNIMAPKALRATFHDSVGFSAAQGVHGGADGSLLFFKDTELTYVPNNGLKPIIDVLFPMLSKYNVSAGDLLQFAGIVATSNCAGSPHFRFLAGRPNPQAPAPDFLIPSPGASVDQQLQRLNDAGFSQSDLVALIASHSMARAPDIDPTIPFPGAPLDISPASLDGQFYLDVLFKGTGFPGASTNFGEVPSGLPNRGELRLQSDHVLARDPRTACQWQGYINNQARLSNDFGRAMFKLALNGQPQGQMFDCSSAVPPPRRPNGRSARYPAGKSEKDVEKSCPTRPFPKL